MPETAVVVGAGVVGCAVALELARSGRPPLLLEAASIASGVSGASLAGITRHLAGGPDEVPFVVESAARWASLSGELLRTVGIDIELDRRGHLALVEGRSAAETEAALRARETTVAAEQGAGLDVEMVGRSEVARLVPALDQRSFRGASWCAGDAKLNALLACRALLASAVAAGARVRCGERVLRLDRGRHWFSAPVKSQP